LDGFNMPSPLAVAMHFKTAPHPGPLPIRWGEGEDRHACARSPIGDSCRCDRFLSPSDRNLIPSLREKDCIVILSLLAHNRDNIPGGSAELDPSPRPSPLLKGEGEAPAAFRCMVGFPQFNGSGAGVRALSITWIRLYGDR